MFKYAKVTLMSKVINVIFGFKTGETNKMMESDMNDVKKVCEEINSSDKLSNKYPPNCVQAIDPHLHGNDRCATINT